MNLNLLNKQGFIHMKNTLSINIIAEIYEYLNNINFNYIIYHDKINLIKKRKMNTIPVKMSLQTFLDGHNIHIKQYNRKVYQLWLPQFEKWKIMPIFYFDNDKNIGSLIQDKSMNYVIALCVNNQKVFNKLFTTTNLQNIFKNYNIMGIKYFINEPGCDEQEIHTDDIYGDTIFVTIPLNFHKNFGTTSVYNNQIVNKYKNIYINKKRNLNNIGNINDFNVEEKIDFLKAEYKESINIGDILIFKGDTFHKGGKNLSDETRHFIHITLKQKDIT